MEMAKPKQPHQNSSVKMPYIHIIVIFLSYWWVNWVSKHPNSLLQTHIAGSGWVGPSAHILWLNIPFPFRDTLQSRTFPSQFNQFHLSPRKKLKVIATTSTLYFLLSVMIGYNWELNSSSQWKLPEGKQGKNLCNSSSKALFFSCINQHAKSQSSVVTSILMEIRLASSTSNKVCILMACIISCTSCFSNAVGQQHHLIRT